MSDPSGVPPDTDEARVREALANLCDCGTETYRSNTEPLAALERLVGELDNARYAEAEYRGGAQKWRELAEAAEVRAEQLEAERDDLDGRLYARVKEAEALEAERDRLAARAEQLEAALQEATEKLAREMWVAAELADGEIYDIDDLRNEWDTDGLLPATYDKWLAVARAAVAGDPPERRE